MIATRTKIAKLDLEDLRGIYWADDSLESFVRALNEIKKNYSYYKRTATAQSKDIERFSKEICNTRIVDTIEKVVLRT